MTNWEAGCLGDGCYYGFDITVPSAKNDVGDITGVKAHCKGRENYDQSRKYNVYESCEILEGPKESGVAAKFSERKPDA
ncbi:hypothetical protein, partial [Acinetobacter baumannii]|uniref:hypothetical protein n=1 Tax=Acinetobacter baumannii TaxID=470 RepID=UPI0011137C63